MRSSRPDKNGSANLEPSFLRKAKLRQELLEARKHHNFGHILGGEVVANVEAGIRNIQGETMVKIDVEKYLLKLVDEDDSKDASQPFKIDNKIVTVSDYRKNN